MDNKVQEMLKLVDKFSNRHHKHEILADCFECWAICISNMVDRTQYDEREKKYLEIVKKYDKHDLALMAELFALVWITLTQMPEKGFGDYLGELYMASDISNKKAGQFFTPYSVSKLSADLTLKGGESLKAENIITLYEPTCGSGGMILAAMDTLQEMGFNYTTDSFTVAGDVDSRCVHACYIQLSLAGVPAIVEQRDALTMELIGGQWKTPAYIFQYLRFKDVLNGTVHGGKK